MKRSFKLRLDAMDDRMTPTSLAFTAGDVPPPPPPDDGGALVSQTAEPAAGTVHIVCDELVVKGERPTKK